MRTAWNKITFTEEQHQFLRENYSKLTNPQLAEALGMKLTRVRNELFQLGLKRMELEYWNEEQIQYLRENYKSKGDTEIAIYFNEKYHKKKGWSKKHVEKKRRYLFLKRTNAEKKQINIRNTSLGMFKICNEKRWLKTGVTGEGTIKIWSNNNRSFKVIKVGNEFVFLNRYLWLTTYGEIAPGMNVCYKDGNPLNCVIENLELLTDGELAIKNKQKNLSYPDEIREVQSIINKINKKIKDYGKKQNE
jgi:hypothetical protein